MPRILRTETGEPLIERFVGPTPIGMMADPIPYITPPDPYVGQGMASAGAGFALAIGTSLAGSPGFSLGAGLADAVGLAVAGSLGVGTGVGFAIGVATGASLSQGDGVSAGTADAAAVGRSLAPAVGSAAGVGAALATDSGAFAGAASGVGTAAGVGARQASGAGASSATGAASGISNATGTGILSVIITRDSDSATAVYSETGATDLGNYVDPQGQFTQGCKRAPVNATFPNFYVYFRKDIGGTPRNEIVFEYGAVFNGPRTYMGPYHASIRIDGVEVVNQAVPYHFHFSRWRWNPNPRPVRTTVASLIASGHIPPLTTAQTNGQTPDPTIAFPGANIYTIMGLAGQAGDMTGVGDHPEVGMVTAYQGYYICTGSGLTAVLAQAESAASWPIHYRDETTGGPLNKTTYPQASSDPGNSANPLLKTDDALRTGTGVPKVIADLAHHGSQSAVPFMLTGDPYYLEEHQFLTNWTAFTQNWTYRAINSSSHILETCGEFLAIRAHGWLCRTVGQMLKIAPTTVPSWLLPKSYWQTYFDQVLTYVNTRYTTGTTPAYVLFRTVERVFGDTGDIGVYPGGDILAGTFGQPYMEDYVACAYGYNAWMHPTTAWPAAAAWKRGNSAARASGTSGWQHEVPEPYRYVMRDTSTSAFYTTWTQSWNKTQSIFLFSYTPGVLYQTNNSVNVGYLCFNRCALTWGKIVGDAAVEPAWTWLQNGLMPAFNSAAQIYCPWQWALDPNA